MPFSTFLILYALYFGAASERELLRTFDLNSRMHAVIQEQRETREREEREAREKAEREAREKAEREAREKAERENREKAERDAALNEQLIGSWRSDPLDVSEMVMESMKQAGDIVPYLEFDKSKLTIQVLFLVGRDGKAILNVDYDSYRRLMDYITEETTAAALRYFESGINKWGIKINLESYLKKLGIDLEDYVAGVIESCSGDFKSSDLHYECYLQVMDEKLYVADKKEELSGSRTYYEFELSEEAFVLERYFVNGIESDKPLGQDVKLPIRLTRMK